MRLLGDIALDATGSANTVVSLPFSPAGTEVFFQAIVIDGADSMVSNTVANEHLAPATDCTALGGTLLVDTVITAADSPCTLVDDMIISPDATLTIDQGVVVNVAGDFVIDVKGGLNVAGSEASPVKFQSSLVAPTAGAWTGLFFDAQTQVARWGGARF